MVTSTYNKFNTAVEWFANGGFRASTLGDVFLFLLTNSAPTPGSSRQRCTGSGAGEARRTGRQRL